MSKEAVDRLRERAQNEQTVFALNDLCNQQKERITELERQNAELVKALYDADHLADCAMSLLLAMNRLTGAEDRLEIDDLDDVAREMAEKEHAQASAQVSEFWTGTRDAAHEYRSRAEKVRTAAPQQQSEKEGGS